MTRVLALLALLSAAVCAFLGARQATSMVLREEPSLYHWPRDRSVHTGGFVWNRGFVNYGGRSDWASFRGGGPGRGK